MEACFGVDELLLFGRAARTVDCFASRGAALARSY